MSRKQSKTDADYAKDTKTGKKGSEPNDQDPQRRLGNYTGAGEHARQGGRKQGLVGQTKQKFGTDRRSKSSGKNQSK